MVSVHLPALYLPVAAMLAGLLIELWFKRRELWALPAAMVYVTVLAWYFADLFINPQEYSFIPDALLNIAYGQVAAFLLLYRLALPWIAGKFVRNAAAEQRRRGSSNPEPIFLAATALWGVLLGIGVMLLHGDVLGALLPLGARSGEVMWQRGAAGDAGASGFLVSTGGYVYELVCASFGVWFVLLRPPLRWLAAALILVSWPFFLLSGTRSIFLAVCMPLFFAYLLFGRGRVQIRVIVLAAAFCVLYVALQVVITYRDVGFQALITAPADRDVPAELSGQQGLNMIQELCYTNMYAATHPSAYGTRYLQEAVNVVPRVLWPSKPLLGIDYAVWRGFGGADSDIGVFATISTGMIGGGILNFGSWLGPVAPALLLAAWSALLARWRAQGTSLLRRLLFLVGLGLTFNLGRDITLLVLWPIVFGYAIVRVAESVVGKRVPSPARGRPPCRHGRRRASPAGGGLPPAGRPVTAPAAPLDRSAMKILNVCQCTNLGGMEQAAFRLMVAMQPLGYAFEVLSLNPLGALKPSLDGAGIPARGLSYTGRGGWRSFGQVRAGLRAARADGLLMTGPHALTMLALGRGPRGPRVLGVHYHHRGVKPDWQWRLIYRLACATVPGDCVPLRVRARRSGGNLPAVAARLARDPLPGHPADPAHPGGTPARPAGAGPARGRAHRRQRGLAHRAQTLGRVPANGRQGRRAVSAGTFRRGGWRAFEGRTDRARRPARPAGKGRMAGLAGPARCLLPEPGCAPLQLGLGHHGPDRAGGDVLRGAGGGLRATGWIEGGHRGRTFRPVARHARHRRARGPGGGLAGRAGGGPAHRSARTRAGG